MKAEELEVLRTSWRRVPGGEVKLLLYTAVQLFEMHGKIQILSDFLTCHKYFDIFNCGISMDSVFFAQHALLQKEYPDCSEFVSSLLETNTIPNPTYERIMTSPHDRL